MPTLSEAFTPTAQTDANTNDPVIKSLAYIRYASDHTLIDLDTATEYARQILDAAIMPPVLIPANAGKGEPTEAAKTEPHAGVRFPKVDGPHIRISVDGPQIQTHPEAPAKHADTYPPMRRGANVWRCISITGVMEQYGGYSPADALESMGDFGRYLAPFYAAYTGTEATRGAHHRGYEYRAEDIEIIEKALDRFVPQHGEIAKTYRTRMAQKCGKPRR